MNTTSIFLVQNENSCLLYTQFNLINTSSSFDWKTFENVSLKREGYLFWRNSVSIFVGKQHFYPENNILTSLFSRPKDSANHSKKIQISTVWSNLLCSTLCVLLHRFWTRTKEEADRTETSSKWSTSLYSIRQSGCRRVWSNKQWTNTRGISPWSSSSSSNFGCDSRIIFRRIFHRIFISTNKDFGSISSQFSSYSSLCSSFLSILFSIFFEGSISFTCCSSLVSSCISWTLVQVWEAVGYLLCNYWQQ